MLVPYRAGGHAVAAVMAATNLTESHMRIR
jgi:hypothetical protein